jgi:hypothetical protein
VTLTKANKRLGTYVVKSFQDESVRAFVPPPLPPEPPLAIQPLLPLLEQANQALGRLDGLASILPDPSLFIYLYVRKEAVLSSQIEGTQSSFVDLMLFENAEAPGVPLEDVQEVSNYVAAMNHGLRRLREDFPLSLRLMREIHEVLLSKGRGSEKHPGEFRTTQNWIGGTRPGNAAFVPPPAEKVMECMGRVRCCRRIRLWFSRKPVGHGPKDQARRLQLLPDSQDAESNACDGIWMTDHVWTIEEMLSACLGLQLRKEKWIEDILGSIAAGGWCQPSVQ